MASLVRVCVTRFLASALPPANLGCQGSSVFFTQAARISSIHVKGRKPRPPPFPYKEKDYNVFRAFFDTTTDRFDENTKVIVVDGPIGAGKTALAKQLAEEFDMHYVPEANMDMLYINDYGYDLRQLDPQLPESCRSYDVKDLNLRPDLQFAANLQILMYQLRYSQYIDALGHLLSTGQGVILDRSVYSDYVFLEAVANQGYISKGGRDVYYDIRANTIGELKKPHLVIYLDIPVKVVKERIKERNLPYEVHSKLMTDKYLEDIEYFYKQRFLKEISTHAELLIYDWSDYGDVEIVVEDIERIEFGNYEHDDPKLKDWQIFQKWDWNELRMIYTKDKQHLMKLFNVARYDVPELVLSGDDIWQRNKVLETAPGERYMKGYNKDMGDTGILTKTKFHKRIF